ncbi:rRNA-processing protein and EBNA1-binding protein ebp2 [Trapelia coarctata]|nr:rRNA-processing protein and EBNA1-binding protein ebp2 [Trapelia coarctata]
MVKKSKLLAALDAHKGRNYEQERQKSLQKKAEKRKKAKTATKSFEDEDLVEDNAEGNSSAAQLEEDSEGWESEDVEGVVEGAHLDNLEATDDSDSDSYPGSADGALSVGYTFPQARELDTAHPDSDALSSDGDLPLSDMDSLSSAERADIIPHQRLTINNTSALLRAHKSIALPLSSLPFSAHQSITSSAQISIPDVNDDLNRELAFYKQCLDAATEGRGLLLKEGVPFTRPNDYFAEMVKSDEHMGKIKAKMHEEASNKKAAAEARRQRDLKKFGKQVQVAKLQERDKAKRETLDKIKVLKRKRKDTDTGNDREEDLFDVALDDAAADKPARTGRKDGKGNSRDKRQKKDAKFGFGGKKRFSKSGDAVSSGDLQSFSAKKMKGVKKGPQRLGKSRRAKV